MWRLCVVAICAACSGGPGPFGDGGPIIPEPIPTGPIGEPMVMFDQYGALGVFRYVDNNGDGDFHDVDEQTVFYRPSATGEEVRRVLVVDRSTLIVEVDDFSGPYSCHIELLQDRNGNGHAMDAGERTPFFTGPLPGGETISTAYPFARDETGAVYIMETPQTVSWSVTRLLDMNGDGDADDPGEATRLVTIGSFGDLDDVRLDSHDRIWFTLSVPKVALYRVDGTTPVTVLTQQDVMTQTNDQVYWTSVFFLLPDAVGLAGILRPPAANYVLHLYTWNDDGDDALRTNELAAAWDSRNGLVPGAVYPVPLEDNSLLINAGNTIRLADQDNDGVYSRSETRIVYDPEIAKMNGHVDTVGQEHYQRMIGTTR